MRDQGIRRTVSQKYQGFSTRAVKRLCLALKQARCYGRLKGWRGGVSSGCWQMYGRDLSASPCVWTPRSPQCLCYPSLRNLLFSFSSLLFDFSELVIPGPGLSKRLRAIKYSSALINCSQSPFWRREKKMTLNYSGPNQGYFWQLPRLRWGGAAGCSVCVFWSGGSVNSMSILSRHNYRHYTIMQGSSNAYFSPDCNFPSCAAQLKDCNGSTKLLYDVRQKDFLPNA